MFRLYYFQIMLGDKIIDYEGCTHIRTTLSPLDLWTDPAGVTALLARWTEKLAGGPQAGTSDSPH